MAEGYLIGMAQPAENRESKKYKIAFLIDGLSMGGAERLMVPILQHLSRVDFEPRVCVFQVKEGNPIAESIRSNASVSRRERKMFTIRQAVKAGAPEPQVAVAGYRKYRWDVYLHYIDYLFVEYKRTAFGLRRKK